jgi:hypothetical protein
MDTVTSKMDKLSSQNGDEIKLDKGRLHRAIPGLGGSCNRQISMGGKK